ncbi:MAG: DUF3291 domain-containing protein, partial [Terriglobales bacterium]
MPLVSITRLRVRSWRFLPSFFLYALRSAREASKAEGNLAARLLRDRNFTFWTSTLWTTDAAMKAFMLAGAHRKAMPRLQHWCDEASVVHWVQEPSELPGWADAYTRLQRDGRASKVRFPSPSHAALR